jgi:hypothetical protein
MMDGIRRVAAASATMLALGCGAESDSTGPIDPDAGGSVVDTGAPLPDAGAASPDAGAASPDADAPLPDAGAASPDAGAPEELRAFRLGFTAWPYAATQEAIQDTYARIRAEGDLITHHFLGGLPWQAALEGTVPANVEEDLCGRLALTFPGAEIGPDALGRCVAPDGPAPLAVYLALDSLDTVRTDLAGYWGATDGLSRADFGWGDATLDDPEVATAFANFSLALIDRLHPAWFNYGSEVSELMLNEPARFDAFVVFAERVSAAIRAVHPELPLLVSVALKHPDASTRQTMVDGMARLAPFVDMMGVSVYPYAFFGHADAGRPANLPEEWLTQAVSIAGGLPLAVTETGRIAERLEIAEYGLDVPATAEDQAAFTQILLTESQSLGAAFINWFTVVDYDALWVTLGNSPVAALWRDTGLFDEALAERPALGIWRAWRDVPTR